jgi:hypothetical protein
MKHPDGTSGQPLSSDFETDFSKALAQLESAVHQVISSGWDDSRRRRAHELSTALCDASKVAGWKETAGVLQALTSLLALPLGEILSVRETVRDKMLELLGMLTRSVRSESA